MLFTAPIPKCKFIYCQSLLREYSGQISIIWDSNTECTQIEVEF